jgi:hypothetical protein
MTSLQSPLARHALPGGAVVQAPLADRAVDKNLVWLSCAIYLVGYAGYSLADTSDAFESLRYLVYAVPLVLALSVVTNGGLPISKAALLLFMTYVTLCLMMYMVGVKDESAFIHEFVILGLIMMIFIPVIRVEFSQIQTTFLVSVAYFALAFVSTDHGGVRLLQILESGTGSGVETGYDNHQGGLVGPVYFVFFAAIGAKFYAAIALVMSVLGGKRIGVIAIIVGLTALLLFRKVAFLRSKGLRFIVLLGCLTLINLMGTNLNSISERAYQKLDVEVSLEEVMLGRYAISSELIRKMNASSTVQTLFGSGAGAANAAATAVTDGTLTLPHNDWLKIRYDYGIVGSIALTVFLACMYSSSAVGASLMLTIAVMMITDNVFVYLYYQFVLALLLLYAGEWETGASRLPWRSLSHRRRDVMG